jgi:Ca-activated chloride channel family protein
MTVRPQGNYFECELYITVSPRGSIYSSVYDTLEAVLDFELNDKAIINDSWLFINDSVYINAKLMDIWTATFIYEGIVKRRRDPSILTKISATKYNIKIFPLVGNSTRTIKINYFVPVKWENNSVKAFLPISIINASYVKQQKIKIYCYEDSSFYSPQLVDNAQESKEIFNPRFGYTRMFEIPLTQPAKDIEIKYKQFFTNGIFASFLRLSNEKFYQLMLSPSEILNNDNNIMSGKNVLFLIDYNPAKSNATQDEINSKLYTAIKSNLTKQDKFNVFYIKNQRVMYYNDWIQATPDNIEMVFDDVLSNSFSISSYLDTEFYLYILHFWQLTMTNSIQSKKTLMK